MQMRSLPYHDAVGQQYIDASCFAHTPAHVHKQIHDLKNYH